MNSLEFTLKQSMNEIQLRIRRERWSVFEIITNPYGVIFVRGSKVILFPPLPPRRVGPKSQRQMDASPAPESRLIFKNERNKSLNKRIK
jgi:hypothetical protein